MFTVALTVIAKNCKQTKCPPTDEQKHKLWSINTREYYAAMKSNTDTCDNNDESQIKKETRPKT